MLACFKFGFIVLILVLNRRNVRATPEGRAGGKVLASLKCHDFD